MALCGFCWPVSGVAARTRRLYCLCVRFVDQCLVWQQGKETVLFVWVLLTSVWCGSKQTVLFVCGFCWPVSGVAARRLYCLCVGCVDQCLVWQPGDCIVCVWVVLTSVWCGSQETVLFVCGFCWPVSGVAGRRKTLRRSCRISSIARTLAE